MDKAANNPRMAVIQVREGRIQGADSWIYVWLHARTGEVIYVGGTGMNPQLRTWLHLNSAEPEIGRVAALYPDSATEPLDVLAFPLRPSFARPEAKAVLISQLAQAGLLGERYAGDAPADSRAVVDSALAAHLRSMVEDVTAYRPTDTAIAEVDSLP